MELEIELSDSFDSPISWRYKLAVRREPAGRHRTLVTNEQVSGNNGVLLLDRPTREDQDDDERLTQTYLEQVAANREFREIATFLRSVEYLHLVPQMIRHGDEARHESAKRDPYGRGFLERIADTSEKRQQSRLSKIGKQLHQILPQFDENLAIERDARGQPHLEAKFRHWRPNAGKQQEDQLSDGTLRLIGLLWALMDGRGPLLLEEPELSLQFDVVGHLPGIFASVGGRRSRQVLITTHSFDLVRDEAITPSEILIVESTPEGSVVSSGAEDKSAVAISNAGGSAGEVLLAGAVSRGGAQLPLRL